MKLLQLLVLLLCISVQAQNLKITGKVTDTSTKEGIAFATIYLPELEKGTITTDDGNFSIQDLPLGKFKMLVSIIGYETWSETINTESGEYIIVDLNPSVIEMQQVIISTPFHQLQKDNVMKVERQTVNELRNQGAMNLADGITNIAGVESITTGGSIGKPVIRGLSANRVLVYTQGIRLENQQFGDEHGLGISDYGIESVEVIKGPASLLYGSDALGGVLYLNPERFAQDNSTEGDLSAKYSSNNLGITTNAGFKTSGEKVKFLVRAGLAEFSDYESPSSRVTNSRSQEYDIKTGLSYQLAKFKTELRYNYNQSNLGIPEEIGEQTTVKKPELPSQKIDNHIISLKNKLFLKNSSIEGKFGYTFNDRTEFEDEDGEKVAALEMELKTFSYDLKYNLPKTGKIETIIGVQGILQENRNFGEEALIPDAQVSDFGILGTSHIHINDKNDIQLGLRYDIRNIDSDERGTSGEEGYFSPLETDFSSLNAALGYKLDISESMIGRLNLASGFRAPNLAELTSNGVHEGTNRFEIGNPNLTNEQNFQVDLAFEYQSEHLEFFFNGFLNRVNDYIFISPDNSFIDGNPVFNYLQENAKLYGGEMGFHWHPHPLDWLHFQSTFETVTGEQDNGTNLPLIPANKFTNTLRIELNKENWVDKGYAFIRLKSVLDQDNVSDFETITPGYNLLDIGFGGNIKFLKSTMALNLNITNIFNTEYINHLSRLKVDNIPNIGRNVNVGMTYEL